MSGLALRLSRLASEARSNGVQSKRVWARLIGVDHRVVVEAVEFDDDAGEIVVSCRLRTGVQRRCGQCGRHCGRYDRGEGRLSVRAAVRRRCTCSSRPTPHASAVPPMG